MNNTDQKSNITLNTNAGHQPHKMQVPMSQMDNLFDTLSNLHSIPDTDRNGCGFTVCFGPYRTIMVWPDWSYARLQSADISMPANFDNIDIGINREKNCSCGTNCLRNMQSGKCTAPLVKKHLLPWLFANTNKSNLQTIKQQVSIHPLDSFLNVSKRNGPDTPYQLEIYHTDKSPTKNVGAIAKYSGKFSYQIGTQVDVRPEVVVNMGCWLTNVIMNECLTNYIRGQYE